MVASNEQTARAARLASIRQEIISGVYGTPQQLSIAVEQLMADALRSEPADIPNRHGNCSSIN